MKLRVVKGRLAGSLHLEHAYFGQRQNLNGGDMKRKSMDFYLARWRGRVGGRKKLHTACPPMEQDAV